MGKDKQGEKESESSQQETKRHKRPPPHHVISVTGSNSRSRAHKAPASMTDHETLYNRIVPLGPRRNGEPTHTHAQTQSGREREKERESARVYPAPDCHRSRLRGLSVAHTARLLFRVQSLALYSPSSPYNTGVFFSREVHKLFPPDGSGAGFALREKSNSVALALRF